MDIQDNNEEALYLWTLANEPDAGDERTPEEQAAGIATACTCVAEEVER
jgi:hypothetical protein